jgi:hypothetical protein
MLRFFRHLRRQLLAKNRTGKYLLYALGEILLVVVGILIALQIDAWKEERENSRRERAFYQSILVDLESDRDKMDALVEFYQNRIANLTWLLRLVRNPDQPRDPVAFGKHTEPLYYNESAISYAAAYEATKNTGAFDRFSNKELLKELVEYYSNFKDIDDVNTSSLRWIESAFEPLMAALTNNFLTTESSEGVLNVGGNTDFYSLLGSVEDKRISDPQKEIEAFLQKTEFESFLIGDLGRSFNMLEQLENRALQLKTLQKGITLYLDD